MTLILELLALAAVAFGLYHRANGGTGRSALHLLPGWLSRLHPAQGDGHLRPLIASLYRSVTDETRRTWWTGEVHVDGETWTIVACPEDAEVLAECRVAVEEDLNAALTANAKRHRIVIGTPLRIEGAEIDPTATRGRPYLRIATPGVAAHARRQPRQPEAGAQPGVFRPSSKPRTNRTNFGSRWEAPTSPLKTIGETLIEKDVRARLLPLDSSLCEPIGVPSKGLVLGRSSELGVGQVRAETVSKRHAHLSREGKRWMLRDLDSHNGTYIGETPIHETEIKDGDIVGLGRRVKLRFATNEEAGAPFAESPT